MPVPSVKICSECVRQMLEHARRAAPQECCGLLAGRGGVITHVYPAINALAAEPGDDVGRSGDATAGVIGSRGKTEYEIAPRELFQIFKQMRTDGLEHMGIYHSHPTTENVPSPRDLARAYYEDVAYFILSPREGAPRPVRAFEIGNGRVAELEVEEVEEAEEVEEKNRPG